MNSFQTKVLNGGLADCLLKWQIKVDKAIEEIQPQFGALPSRLAEACRYALSGGGKRFRPAMVFMMADALGNKRDVRYAALAVEMFHTSSLIADDLPCMDDDDLRRNRPSLHRVYGEAVALLASYALIAEGYLCLAKNEGAENGKLLQMALENAAFNTGSQGATGGQYLDLYPPNLHLETALEVLQKKTVTLFEIAFVLGWLFGQGEVEKLPRVKKAAHHFGMAFQIADDFGDLKQDQSKNEKPAVNLALILGEEEAKKRFYSDVEGYRREMKALGLEKSELAQIIEILTETGV